MLLSSQKSEGQDICHKNQLYQIEKYKANKDSYEVKLVKARSGTLKADCISGSLAIVMKGKGFWTCGVKKKTIGLTCAGQIIP